MIVYVNANHFNTVSFHPKENVKIFANIKILQHTLQDNVFAEFPPIADISFNNYAVIFDVG